MEDNSSPADGGRGGGDNNNSNDSSDGGGDNTNKISSSSQGQGVGVVVSSATTSSSGNNNRGHHQDDPLEEDEGGSYDDDGDDDRKPPAIEETGEGGEEEGGGGKQRQQQEQQERQDGPAAAAAAAAAAATTTNATVDGVSAVAAAGAATAASSASLQSSPPPAPSSFRKRKGKPEKSNHQLRWDEMYSRLCDYHQRFGNANVPNRYADDPQLGSWVSAQRRAYKTITSGATGSTAMTLERATKLKQLGFEWEAVNPNNVPWETRYNELLAFVKKYGHANVPMRWKENVQLSNWVSKQRHDYKLLHRGTSSRLTERRQKLLNDVNFIWEVERGSSIAQLQRVAVVGLPTRKPRRTSEGEVGAIDDGEACGTSNSLSQQSLASPLRQQSQSRTARASEDQTPADDLAVRSNIASQGLESPTTSTGGSAEELTMLAGPNARQLQPPDLSGQRSGGGAINETQSNATTAAFGGPNSGAQLVTGLGALQQLIQGAGGNGAAVNSSVAQPPMVIVPIVALMPQPQQGQGTASAAPAAGANPQTSPSNNAAVNVLSALMSLLSGNATVPNPLVAATPQPNHFGGNGVNPPAQLGPAPAPAPAPAGPVPSVVPSAIQVFPPSIPPPTQQQIPAQSQQLPVPAPQQIPPAAVHQIPTPGTPQQNLATAPQQIPTQATQQIPTQATQQIPAPAQQPAANLQATLLGLASALGGTLQPQLPQAAVPQGPTRASAQAVPAAPAASSASSSSAVAPPVAAHPNHNQSSFASLLNPAVSGTNPGQQLAASALASALAGTSTPAPGFSFLAPQAAPAAAPPPSDIAGALVTTLSRFFETSSSQPSTNPQQPLQALPTPQVQAQPAQAAVPAPVLAGPAQNLATALSQFFSENSNVTSISTNNPMQHRSHSANADPERDEPPDKRARTS